MPDAGYVIAFDFGMKHIGTAVGQTVSRTASPLRTLNARNGKPRWSDIAALIDEWQPIALLVGLPLNMDDTENHVTLAAREFAEALRERFDQPVELVDERLTTKAALEETGGDVAAAHNVAAALIAETYLR